MRAKQLDKTSSIFFAAGFFISKLQFMPFIFASITFNLTGLLLFSVGYLLWVLACLLYPDHPAHQGKWYAFTQFKNQHMIGAVIGLLATTCCIIGFFFPLSLVVGSWLFLIGNCIWSLGEYHKKQHPPAYLKDYSSNKQAAYLRYVVIITLMSLVTALSTTICIAVPIVAPLLMTLSIALGIYLGIMAFDAWTDYTFNAHKPDQNYRGKDWIPLKVIHDYSNEYSDDCCASPPNIEDHSAASISTKNNQIEPNKNGSGPGFFTEKSSATDPLQVNSDQQDQAIPTA